MTLSAALYALLGLLAAFVGYGTVSRRKGRQQAEQKAKEADHERSKSAEERADEARRDAPAGSADAARYLRDKGYWRDRD